jgi:hypothetical protein
MLNHPVLANFSVRPFVSKETSSHLPDLQSPRAQNSSPLIFGHVWGCCPILIRNLLILWRLICLSVRGSSWIAGNYHSPIACSKKLVWVLADGKIVNGSVCLDTLIIRIWIYGFFGFVLL